MTNHPPSRKNRAPGTTDLLLQILGIAGTNHVLTSLLSWLPGYAASRLHGDLELFGHAGWIDLAQALLTFAVLPGLAEELLFRGLLFGLLLRFKGPIWAILGSAAAFGLVHVDPHHIFVAMALGLQLGWIRHLYGLGLAITAHITNNALLLLMRFAAEAPGFERFIIEPGPFTALVAAAIAGSACAALMQRARSIGEETEPPRTTLQTRGEMDESR